MALSVISSSSTDRVRVLIETAKRRSQRPTIAFWVDEFSSRKRAENVQMTASLLAAERYWILQCSVSFATLSCHSSTKIALSRLYSCIFDLSVHMTRCVSFSTCHLRFGRLVIPALDRPDKPHRNRFRLVDRCFISEIVARK
jgi:hypothetical protein